MPAVLLRLCRVVAPSLTPESYNLAVMNPAPSLGWERDFFLENVSEQ